MDIRWHRARKLRNDCTDMERLLWSKIRGRQIRGIKFRRQYPIGPFIVDFVAIEHRLVVELDGGQHAQQLQYDERRSCCLQSVGYRVLRFWNHEVGLHLEDVLVAIDRVLANE